MAKRAPNLSTRCFANLSDKNPDGVNRNINGSKIRAFTIAVSITCI
jgi:hypothetical protein